MKTKTIYLRVDVDFNLGLKKGVPFLLDLFSEKNICGTFFVVMGPDTLYRHTSRVGKKGYKKRLASFNWLKLLYYVGFAYLRSRFLRPAVGPDAPEVLKQIIDKGHELGIHGYNHAEWSDRCFEFDRDETERQIDQAVDQFKTLFPNRDWIWGAPNWKLNTHMLNHLEKSGVSYSSDLRGHAPFYPFIGGRKYKTVQFPINLPCLHELVQLGISKKQIPSLFFRLLDQNYNLLCVHDYYEGLLERQLFVDLIGQLQDKGYRFQPLQEAFQNLSSFPPTESSVSTVKVPGGIMEVSCQSEFMSENYFKVLEEFIRVGQ